VKFVPCLSSDEQKQRCVFVCQELLDDVRNSQNFLSRVVTGHETQVYCYDPESRQQSSLGPKKARQVRSDIKSMMVIFLTVRAQFIRNLFLHAKWLSSITTWRFQNV
jgi:hypothetical protein